MNAAKLLLDHTENIVLVIRGGVIDSVHGCLEALGGNAAVSKIVGQRMVDIMHGVDAAGRSNCNVAGLPAGSDVSGSFNGRLALSEVAARDFNFRIIQDEEENAFVLIGRDVTEELVMRRRLERARRMEAIGMVAGGIAHDFNNVLMGLIGYADIASDAVEDGSDLQRYLGHILSGAYRARELVRQLLRFSRRPGQGGSVALNVLVKGVAKAFATSIPAHMLFDCHISGETMMLDCDAERVEHIMVAACDSLIESLSSSTSGKICIDLADHVVGDGHEMVVGMGLRPGGYGVISIQALRGDREAIIPQGDFIQTAFDGLSRIGGGLSVEHLEDGAVVMHIWLPVTMQSSVSGYGRDDGEAVAKQPVRGCGRVLLVEDEKLLLSMMDRMLSGLGYTVVTASDGSAAYALFKADPGGFGVVVTDYLMPKMRGLEMAEKMLEIRPGIPIIMLTAFSERVTQLEAMNAGISQYLLKPVDRIELSRAIKAAIIQPRNG